MIVDAWMQHPTERHSANEMFASLRRWTRATPRPAVITPEMTISAMDEGHVTAGLAAAWCAPDGWMISNDEVAAVAAAYPDRIIGVASASLHKPMDAVRELRRAVKQLGFRALRVVPWLWNLPPTDRRYYPLYAECIELDIPFCTQVGHTGPLRPSETGRPIPYIDEVALEFPELRIVAGHIGYPWTQEMIAVATKHENVFIDTSAYTTKRYPAELVQYMRGHGREKVLFGTNYPMIRAAKALEGLGELALDDEAKALFLGGNAVRVFKLEQFIAQRRAA
ncbi:MULTISPECIES: amidohydrolase family protein [unclassified Bradyrhizobium]|uniref:amidohydrolase family protein n=1 Tax=unclassified Bradyrhizobium TaxID=2631580 RepID=UPI001BAB9D2F|nr:MULTISPECIES: amidohydrolase family protein [unclassified Bradyrhizobium]MBR1223974.1 amidohydrolase [Bradyrhizobium sp. AUGA SZCCT0176]MBR1233500.1 amidohydrolase [Bradyrhizobium sp. AUGA SZCCT0182]MBR1298402.1 amidohydrolase [Bradyrhizobium sp. AUGA SZCCT0042]